jgi:hypothetical protein
MVATSVTICAPYDLDISDPNGSAAAAAYTADATYCLAIVHERAAAEGRARVKHSAFSSASSSALHRVVEAADASDGTRDGGPGGAGDESISTRAAAVTTDSSGWKESYMESVERSLHAGDETWPGGPGDDANVPGREGNGTAAANAASREAAVKAAAVLDATRPNQVKS